MNDVVIVAAKRTPIGKFMGSLSKISAPYMGAHVISGLLKSIELAPEEIDEVFLGQVLTAGCGQNPARQALIHGGLSENASAMTVNLVCGSGLWAVHLAAQSVFCDQDKIVIAGGQENMSSAPHVLSNSREGTRMGNTELLDTMLVDGLWDAYNDYHMGITAENVAKRFNVSREDQDKLAVLSQNKAEAARKSGRFKEEILPVLIPGKGGEILFEDDEFIKEGTSLERMQALRPVFKKDGTVTAGNASGINDGAAAVLLMSAKNADRLGLTPLARITACASAGVDPAIMGIGPVPASQACLRKAGWNVNDLDLIEVNEAFAAQAVAVNRAMGWDIDKVNVNGGAIALGHPIGASGCRILVTLLHEMRRREAKRGLASLCVGGGMGVAMAVERY